MKIVGITGGIGSGKTTVAHMFQDLGIPVYNSDNEAKELTNSSQIIRTELISLFGTEAYKDGTLNRKFLAEKIFNDKLLLEKVNAIIHPQVALHFSNWVSEQNSKYVLKEAAILYESGAYKYCDLVILVIASEKERIRRVIERDKVSKEEVMARMKNQWSDERKMNLADFIIQNDDLSETLKQVISIHSQLI